MLSHLPTFFAAFLASLVEFVEALTVVLAVGATRGWRPAIEGAASGLAALLALLAVFGRSLALLPLHLVQLAVGTLLLLFGLRWLRKAVKRAAGLIPLHDEAALYAAETGRLSAEPRPDRRDWLATGTAFKIVMLEGIEVIFIVLAIGAAGRQWMAAGSGAALALLAVIGLGLMLHKPLTRVPENSLKFAVGVLLTAFGLFWAVEGLGLAWPGGDWALPVLVLAFLATALVSVRLLRRPAPPYQPPPKAR
jgi:uncharacterized membrane protein